MIQKSNYYLVIYVVILILTINSCKNTPIVQATNDLVLKGKEFSLSGTICPIDIQNVDSFIIIKEQCDEYFYHVYNKNTLKLAGKFGGKGRGPNEYLAPTIMNQIVVKNDSSYIYIFDNTLKRINCVNILATIKNKAYYSQSLNISRNNIYELFPLSSAVFTADSFFVGTTDNSQIVKGRFFCFEKSNGNVIWEPFYPAVKNTPTSMRLTRLYSTHLALKPDGEEIATASLFFKRLDILNKRGQLKRSIVFETQNFEPNFSSGSIPTDTYQYFNRLMVSEKYIYALDKNAKINELEANMKFSRDSIWLYMSDWQGITINRYNLTPRVLRFSVDEQQQKIYGINDAYDSNSLFVYDMKNGTQ